MRHLIQELMEPRQYADGTIKQPTAVMMAAGREIMRINELWEQDRAGRSRAEILINGLTEEVEGLTKKIIKLSEKSPTLEDAIIAFQEAKNAEFNRDFT